MTITSRPDFTVASKAIAAWTMTALSCLWVTSVLAADAPAEGAAPATAPYTVGQSTPIDKVVQKVYANSPLNIQVLRQALVDANPKVISGNPQQRVKAGTVLTVPDHAHVVRNALTPFAAASDNSESGPAARDYPVRRQWVRFP
jgi:Tfp pilus assembly protein FimV